MRRYCHLLGVGAALLIAAVTVLTTVAWSAGTLLCTETVEGCGTAEQDYVGPACCGDCHPEQELAWSHTPHAGACADPQFQQALGAEEDRTACLGCHTTGYDQGTGRYELAGVTCERCHGAYQPDHLKSWMQVQAPTELCGSCHQDRLVEWQIGGHGHEEGEGQEDCIACHQVHG